MKNLNQHGYGCYHTCSTFEVVSDIINMDAMTKLIVVGIKVHPCSRIFLEIFNKYGCYQQIKDARLQDWVKERNMKVALCVDGVKKHTYNLNTRR